jgi:hypothetical protein
MVIAYTYLLKESVNIMDPLPVFNSSLSVTIVALNNLPELGHAVIHTWELNAVFICTCAENQWNSADGPSFVL